MVQKFKKYLKRLRKEAHNKELAVINDLDYCKSYSQAGEDRIIEFFFRTIGKMYISYLEIGTNDPVFGNNTYFFYRRKSRGVCIEANPNLIEKIKSKRSKDTVLNLGITDQDNSVLNFYIFGDEDKFKALSTFSKSEAEHVESNLNTKIEKIIEIPTLSINSVIAKYFHDNVPDLISLDAEGLDIKILKSLDFNKYRPTVICVETVNFSVSHKKIKNVEIIEFMLSQHYFIYADSGINTIFIDEFKFNEI